MKENKIICRSVYKNKNEEEQKRKIQELVLELIIKRLKREKLF